MFDFYIWALVLLFRAWFDFLTAFASFWSCSSVGSWSHQLIAVCLLYVLVQRPHYVWACLCLSKLIQKIFYYCIWSKRGECVWLKAINHYVILSGSPLFFWSHNMAYLYRWSPTLRWFNLSFFDFTVVREWYALSRNVLLNFDHFLG